MNEKQKAAYQEAEEKIERAKFCEATVLYLSEMSLTALPASIGELTQLQVLFLQNNQLTELPDSISALSQLQRLTLSNNQLSQLPNSIGALKQLQTLELWDNQLTKLPNSISELSKLQQLYLGDNLFAQLPDSIGALSQLQKLSLWMNELLQLPDSVGKLLQLKKLHLTGNQLSELPKSLCQLEQLEELFLHHNSALGLPPEILGPELKGVYGRGETAANPTDILNYYFRPKRPLNEAKLILVGFGKVGKTSLVNRLVHDQFDAKEQKTEGIQITQWPVQDDSIKLHVWDFGGQEIMHSTHQFFLSHRSLYLLVLNGRQGHEDADAEYWLNLIRSFGGDSPVIVVLNKQQEHPFDLNRQNLHSKFPGMIKAFIKTECEDPAHGLDELEQTILHELEQLDGLHDGFPEEWFAIKDELAAMSDNYLTFEEYRKVCNRLGETIPTDQDQLAGYLHQLGVALNYKDDSRLRDMHVLNPRWVTEGIYTILNAKALEERQGELHIDCLQQILDPDNYPVQRHAFLLNLMRKFNLCFAFPNREGHYLIPDLAAKNQPESADAFIPAECLNFRYRYPALHEGVLPSFITRTYILSEGEPRWRTGVILAFEQCRALIKADLPERTVIISVSGPSAEGRRRLLAVIRHEFEAIHRTFEFTPQEYVPVPQHPEVEIAYKELLVFEQKHITQKPQVINDDVIELDVQELLNGVDLEGARQPTTKREPEQVSGLKLFYSYSHKDEALREELETHLKILQRQKLIQGWNDRLIMPGEKWGEEIDRNLEEADLILLLVSADFLASDYCYDIEMKRALERHEADETTVIPIILRESQWSGAPFAHLQALPKDAKPVMAYERRDVAWNEIAGKISTLANMDINNRWKHNSHTQGEGVRRTSSPKRCECDTASRSC